MAAKEISVKRHVVRLISPGLSDGQLVPAPCSATNTPIVGAPNRRRCDGDICGHPCANANERAADAAEVIAVEKIGVAALADRRKSASGRRWRFAHRAGSRGAAEVKVLKIEDAPVCRGEVVVRVRGTREVGRSETASPSLQKIARNVLPVAAKSDFPSPLIPPCAHMPRLARASKSSIVCRARSRIRRRHTHDTRRHRSSAR